MIFIKSINISIKKFEETAGLSNGYINNLKSQPRDENIQKIIQSFPILNRVWLLTGEGDMLLPKDGNVATVVGDGTAVAGNSNHVEVPTITSKALDEISAQRMLTQKAQEQLDKAYDQVSKAQEQIDRLITLLEKQHK